jgi:hypothetical protein
VNTAPAFYGAYLGTKVKANIKVADLTKDNSYSDIILFLF